MLIAPRRSIMRAALATFAAAGFAIAAHAENAETSEAWKSLQKDIFGTRQIEDGAGKIKLETPVRAEDAAVVPITVTMPADFAPGVKSLTLVIDKNPVPVVGTFTYGPAAGSGERMIETRVRIDQYSDVRAIAETTDGKLFMVSNFVKASGGCSAPASKDAEEAAKTLGKMKIKTAIGKTGNGLSQEAQVMIKHPNTSGLQMDQLTGLYTPARYIDKVEVKSGDQVVFSLEGGISFSEDPNIIFTYEGKASDPMVVTASDSDGTHFAGRSTPSQS